jgi:hypothetical protein
MQPHLQIRCLGPQVYAYSVSAGGKVTQPADETTLASLEHCLDDAGASLGHYFSSVQISLQGQVLGSFAVGLVQRNAPGLASQLREKLVREHPPLAAAGAML